MIAFAWAYVVGVFVHENLKPIKILKHGKMAKSLFKYGLEYIDNLLLNPFLITKFDVLEILSCT